MIAPLPARQSRPGLDAGGRIDSSRRWGGAPYPPTVADLAIETSREAVIPIRDRRRDLAALSSPLQRFRFDCRGGRRWQVPAPRHSVRSRRSAAPARDRSPGGPGSRRRAAAPGRVRPASAASPQAATVRNLPCGSTRSRPMKASSTGHSNCGAPGRCQVSTSAAPNSTPARRPNNRPAAKAETSTKKKSQRFHDVSHAPSARSTPPAWSSRHPGGRCSVAATLEKSACHAVAGKLPMSPVIRLSALMLASPWRTSTPSGRRPPSA